MKENEKIVISKMVYAWSIQEEYKQNNSLEDNFLMSSF